MIKTKEVDEKPVSDTEDIYKEKVIETLVEDDELSYEEEAFMQGYNEL